LKENFNGVESGFATSERESQLEPMAFSAKSFSKSSAAFLPR